LQALVDGARGQPAEFHADLLLRLAAAPHAAEAIDGAAAAAVAAGADAIRDAVTRWKRELIEEAFTVGAQAQLPYHRWGEANTDARASRQFWSNNLEALTLQTRAVSAMMALDPQRARALFDDIRIPQVAELKCQDFGVPDLSAYYLSAADVFARGFTAKEREKLEHIDFLTQLIGRMQSPAHVTPMVKLLFTAPVTAEQRQDLIFRFAAALERVTATPRIFSALSFGLLPVSAPVKLPEGVRPLPPMLAAPTPGTAPEEVAAVAPALMPALRSYIVRFIRGPRCSEDIQPGRLPLPAVDFNYLAGQLDPAASLYKPISEDEAKPLRDDGRQEQHWWWQSDRSRQVLMAMKWLNHGNRDLPDDQRFWTTEERMSDEWNAHFIDTLKLIEGWKEEEEGTREDWFGMVSESYEMLAEKAPPGKARESATVRYLNFMETHYPDIESHNLWFTQWHEQWRSKDPWMVEQLMRSSNPVIALYAKVQKLASP
jgi:hypothetical protein